MRNSKVKKEIKGSNVTSELLVVGGTYLESQHSEGGGRKTTINSRLVWATQEVPANHCSAFWRGSSTLSSRPVWAI